MQKLISGLVVSTLAVGFAAACGGTEGTGASGNGGRASSGGGTSGGMAASAGGNTFGGVGSTNGGNSFNTGGSANGGSSNSGGSANGGASNNGGATSGGSTNGGSANGGSSNNGGSTNGGSANGGSASGGSSNNGGSTSGGFANGGANTGGSTTGGASNGGSAGSANGGSANGGAAAGGAANGGSANGGAANGGAAAGGVANGGSGSGGKASGGASSGGTSNGGTGNGGTAAGGAANGGSGSGGKASGGASNGGTGAGGTGSGGTSTGGAASGGSGSGGAGGACTVTNGLSSNNGELTCYYFGQGTSKGTCMGATTYKTNCGYCGTEGSASGNACNPGHNDQVANISTGNYFVAIPSFGQGASCGLCVSVSYGGKTQIATVVDNCATCQAGSAHIDLSPALGAALGMGVASGQTEDAKSGVTFKSVACPVTSNIVAVYNGVYTGQLYIQNLAFPLASASAVVNNTTHVASLNNGFWDFGITLPVGAALTLKDTQGHTVTGTLGANGASIGVQFPLTCQ